jgi:putative SOS response-associated peptidase YedK
VCGRFTISKTEQELEKRFGANFYSKVLEARYNVAPTQLSAVITHDEPEAMQLFRWGLVPFWAKDLGIGARMINARSETVSEKPAFKDAYRKRRCLVLADGYYEWIKRGKEKIPHRIQIRDQAPFAMAGLWERWKPKTPEAETVHTFTIITVPAAKSVEHIHDRMPAILTREQERLWLDLDLPEKEAKQLLLPYPEDELQYYTVSKKVNSTRNESEDLLEPVDYSEEEEPPAQPDLFSGLS